jgi:hypothetical protein
MKFSPQQKEIALTIVNRLPSVQINMDRLNELINDNNDEYDKYISDEFKKGRTNSIEFIAEKTLELLRRSKSSSKSSSKSTSKSKSPLGSGSRKGGRKSKKSRKTKRRR